MKMLVAIPEWFVQWGWMACVGAIFLIAIIITIIVLAVKRKKATAADENAAESEAEEQPVAQVEEESEGSAPVEEEAEEEEEPVKEQETATKSENEAKAESVAKAEGEVKAQPANKTYHVSKRKADGRWQVKMAGGSRAIKLFFTQLEAIDFAKKLAENQEAKIVIHKEDGTFRRLTYHSKK